MEDAHQHILQLSPEDPNAAYFAVFDGHGGSMVARHASIHLHRHIVNRAEYQEGNIPEAIREGFLECDRAMKGSQELKDEMAGCTAIMVLLKDNKLWCGNAGDSRCIAGVNGDAVALSIDHKPNDPLEMERIVSAGGFVEFNRVNGNLALSRALGDFIFKTDDELPQNKQIVSAEPDVQTRVVAEVNIFFFIFFFHLVLSSSKVFFKGYTVKCLKLLYKSTHYDLNGSCFFFHVQYILIQ